MKIAVEGIIGSNKTILLNELNTVAQVEITTHADINKPWYNEMVKGANHAVLALQFQHLLNHSHIKTNGNMICKGSIFSVYYVYCAMYYHLKFLSDEEFKLLGDYYKHFLSEIEPINAIIYIKTPVRVAYQRIKDRGFSQEVNIDIKLLHNLNNLYGNVFQELSHLFNIKICRIDGTLPLPKLLKSVRRAIFRITRHPIRYQSSPLDITLRIHTDSYRKAYWELTDRAIDKFRKLEWKFYRQLCNQEEDELIISDSESN